MKVVKTIIIGFGVIGRAVAESLLEKQQAFKKQGVDFKIVAVCEKEGCILDEAGINLKPLLSKKFSKSPGFKKISSLKSIKSIGCDLVVECTPAGIKKGEPGMSHIKAALSRGIHVVTSNKSPLALDYNGLMNLARKNNVQLLFEATVGGAIPLLGLKSNGLCSNKVSNIYGVLNGTSNYVLTKMEQEGVPLELALAEAQQLGYAEADPTYDIDGIDTAAKVVILANHFLGKKAVFSDVKVNGIREVKPEALELAKEHGYSIKLVGDACKLEVAPKLVPHDHPLNVTDNLNAVLLETDLAGEVSLIGQGAGGVQTSSAIIADMLKIAEAL